MFKHVLKNRKAVRKCLTGAGLGDANNIACRAIDAQRRRQRLCLHSCRARKLQCCQCTLKPWVQRDVFPAGQRGFGGLSTVITGIVIDKKVVLPCE